MIMLGNNEKKGKKHVAVIHGWEMARGNFLDQSLTREERLSLIADAWESKSRMSWNDKDFMAGWMSGRKR